MNFHTKYRQREIGQMIKKTYKSKIRCKKVRDQIITKIIIKIGTNSHRINKEEEIMQYHQIHKMMKILKLKIKIKRLNQILNYIVNNQIESYNLQKTKGKN